MKHHSTVQLEDHVLSVNPAGSSSVVLVCEHASSHIPEQFADLGLSSEARTSHAAWDPGAMEVAERLSKHLDAALLASGISRLVYDCNRPSGAPDAMPEKSEVVDVPGNVGLTSEAKAARVTQVYDPFNRAVSAQIARTADPVLVTLHSFTPVYFGTPRMVEIGILCDSDERLADAMMATAKAHTAHSVQRNEPYGPDDGVTHTLREHGLKNGHLNVMIEVRNDLISRASDQDRMARLLARWIADAFVRTKASGVVQCQA